MKTINKKLEFSDENKEHFYSFLKNMKYFENMKSVPI